MSEYSGAPRSPEPSRWALAGITFAASLLTLAGAFQALAGLAAIVDDEFYVVARNYTFDIDVTAWGWIHLIVGLLLLATGLALFTGRAWAAMTALLIAMISALTNFFFIPYYPWWSLLIIALDIWVIWSLTRPGALRAQ
jgi:hypothetical protein